MIVVEHDEDAIRLADYVLDIGPGAGVHGGRIVAEGTPVPSDSAVVNFDPAHINIYSNDWRVAPKGEVAA